MKNTFRNMIKSAMAVSIAVVVTITTCCTEVLAAGLNENSMSGTENSTSRVETQSYSDSSEDPKADFINCPYEDDYHDEYEYEYLGAIPSDGSEFDVLVPSLYSAKIYSFIPEKTGEYHWETTNNTSIDVVIYDSDWNLNSNYINSDSAIFDAGKIYYIVFCCYYDYHEYDNVTSLSCTFTRLKDIESITILSEPDNKEVNVGTYYGSNSENGLAIQLNYTDGTYDQVYSVWPVMEYNNHVISIYMDNGTYKEGNNTVYVTAGGKLASFNMTGKSFEDSYDTIQEITESNTITIDSSEGKDSVYKIVPQKDGFYNVDVNNDEGIANIVRVYEEDGTFVANQSENQNECHAVLEKNHTYYIVIDGIVCTTRTIEVNWSDNIVGMEITKYPSDLKCITSVDYNDLDDNVDLTGFEVKMQYADGTSKTVSYDPDDDFILKTDNSDRKIQTGVNNIKFWYENFSVTLTVTGVEPQNYYDVTDEISENDKIQTTIENPNDSVVYSFTPTETKRYIIYPLRDKNGIDTDAYCWIYDAAGKLINTYYTDNYRTIATLTAGETYYLVCNYKYGETGTFTVCVDEQKDIKSIEVITVPTENTLPIGTLYWNIKYEGLSFKVTYNDNTTEMYKYEDGLLHGYAFTSNFWYIAEKGSIKAGENIDTCDYRGTTFEVTFYGVTPVELYDVTGTITGDSFTGTSTNDGYIIYEYTPKETGSYSFNSASVLIYDKDLNALSNINTSLNYNYDENASQVFDLTGGEKYYVVVNNKYFVNGTEFTINIVKNKPVQSIEITKLPSRTIFIAGSSEISYNGMEVTVTYNDGTTSIWKADSSGQLLGGFFMDLIISDGSVATGDNTVTVSYRGLTDEFTITGIDVRELYDNAIEVEPGSSYDFTIANEGDVVIYKYTATEDNNYYGYTDDMTSFFTEAKYDETEDFYYWGDDNYSSCDEYMQEGTTHYYIVGYKYDAQKQTGTGTFIFTKAKTVENMEITKMPDKIYYSDLTNVNIPELDYSGLEITIHFTDETEVVWKYDDVDKYLYGKEIYVGSGYNEEQAIVFISYSNGYCEYNIYPSIEKAQSTITIGKTSYTVADGSTAFSLNASVTGGSISYVSSNTDVAEVSDTGVVTPKAPGKTVITLSSAETTDYKAAESKTVTVIVTASSNSTYTVGNYSYKVTDDSTDGSGTVSVTACSSSTSSVTVPNKVTIGQYSYKVASIATYSLGYIKNSAGTYQKIDEFKIYGNSGSAAETYAEANGFIFVDVNKKDITKSTVTLSATSYSYTGSAIKAGVTVQYNGSTLKSGSDYSVTYSNNTELGTASLVIKGIGDYNGQVTKTYKINLATPTLSTVTNTATGDKVAWSKVAGAAGYYVYRKTTGSWSKIATVTGGDTVSYIDKTATAGTTYTYTVVAYSGSYISGYNTTGKTIKRLTQPAPTVTNASTGVTVKWSKITGASGYYVYRKTSSTSWTKIGTITSGSTVSYVDKTAKAGTSYTYTVKAYSGTYASSYISGVTIKRLTQPAPTVTNTSTGVTVKWSKITGASGYYVYRKTGSGSWVKVGTITSGSTVSYVDRTAKAGTSYTYTVKAYSGTYASSYTSGVTIKRLTQPAPTVTNTSTGVTVKWSKITGASGYYVYRKTSSGSWVKIGTIKSGSTVSYVDKTAKAGTTYTYTVKAYSGTYASSYISGKTIKRLAQPVLKVTKATKGVTVKWDKVTGASGYYIYRKTGKGSWVKVGTVKSGSTVSYTDKTAKTGTTYTYTVKAYSGSYVSSFSTSGKSIKR